MRKIEAERLASREHRGIILVSFVCHADPRACKSGRGSFHRVEATMPSHRNIAHELAGKNPVEAERIVNEEDF